MAESVSFNVPFILSGKYFEIVHQDGQKVEAKCKQCKDDKVYKGFISSTSNFHLHLKRKHQHLLIDFDKESKEFSASKKRKLSNHPGEPILKYVKVDESKSMSVFDRKIVRFIVNGMHSLSIVEEPDFRALFSDQKIHSRQTYKRKIQNLSIELRNDVIKTLGNASHICLTCDLWTCKGMTRSFMGVTAHWIIVTKSGFERKSAALACRRFKGSHTFDKIAELITGIMKEYQISNEKVVKIVTDNGSNFVKAFAEFAEGAVSDDDDFNSVEFGDVDASLVPHDDSELVLPSHGRCASHTLSLICTSDLAKSKASRVQQSAFAKCYGIWNKMSKSTQVFEEIKDITKTRPTTPVVTRWNSFYDSVCYLLDHRSDLAKVSEAAKISAFSETDLDFLEGYCKSLKPIADALDRLQGEKSVYYGDLIPTIITVRDRLHRLNQDPPKNSSKILEVILSGLKNRFSKMLELSDDYKDAVIASVSHPFFKLRWVPEDKKEEVKELFIKTVLEHREQINVIRESMHDETLSEYDDFFGFSKSDESYACIENEDTETEVRQQCLKYLLNSKTGLDILKEYPLIEKVFLKFNTTLPSSAPVERLFSYSNMILCPSRRKLGDDIFEDLVLLKVNEFEK